MIGLNVVKYKKLIINILSNLGHASQLRTYYYIPYYNIICPSPNMQIMRQLQPWVQKYLEHLHHLFSDIYHSFLSIFRVQVDQNS